MTTIAAICDETGIYIAADGRASSGSDILSETYPKIFRVIGDSGILAISGSVFFCNLIRTTEGCAGSPEAMGQMLVEIFRDAGFKPQDHDRRPHDYGFSALIAHEGSLWEIGCDGAMIQKLPGELAAVGSGWQYAIGSMASTSLTPNGPLARCQQAVRVAAKYDSGTGGLWSTCSLTPNGIEGDHLEDSLLSIENPDPQSDRHRVGRL